MTIGSLRNNNLPTERHIKYSCTSFIFDNFCTAGPKNMHSSSGCAVTSNTRCGWLSNSNIFRLRETRKQVQTYPTTSTDAVTSIAEFKSITSNIFRWNILYGMLRARRDETVIGRQSYIIDNTNETTSHTRIYGIEWHVRLLDV